LAGIGRRVWAFIIARQESKMARIWFGFGSGGMMNMSSSSARDASSFAPLRFKS
jgi:hypothetical protein